MNRLTGRAGSRAYIRNCPELYLPPNVRELITKVVQKLANYEDTCLEPDEVSFAIDINDCMGDFKIDRARLRELAEADKDGRVVVLPYPFKSEDMITYGTSNCMYCVGIDDCFVRNKSNPSVPPTKIPFRWMRINRFGKDVFPTADEAKQAIMRMKEKSGEDNGTR